MPYTGGLHRWHQTSFPCVCVPGGKLRCSSGGYRLPPSLSYFLSPICSCSPRGIVDHIADCWLLHRKNSETAGRPSQGQTDVQVTGRGSEWQFGWAGERVEGSQVRLETCAEMRETSILQRRLTKMEKRKSSFPVTCLPLMRAKWCSPHPSQEAATRTFFFLSFFPFFSYCLMVVPSDEKTNLTDFSGPGLSLI